MYKAGVLFVAFAVALMLGGAAFAATQQVEAESMQMPADGYSILSSSAASGGKYVNLHKNRTISAGFSGAVDKLTVRAKGRYYYGAWPRMVVRVDGTTVLSRTASSSTFQDFTVDLPTNIADGTHTLSVSFTNDYSYRNLHVDAVTIDSGTTTPSPPPPDSGGTLPPPPTSSATWCPTSPEQLALTANEQTMVELHNRARSQNGVKPLCLDSRLVRAARLHAQDMIVNDYFSHYSLDGRDPGARISAQGYRWWTYGENIAMGSSGYSTPQSTFDGWMSSAGHRSNILSSSFTEVGIGEAVGECRGRQGTQMWVAVFSRRY